MGRAGLDRYAPIRKRPTASYWIDINVWLAPNWDRQPQYVLADVAALLFCRFTMLGLLRLLTNQKVMGDSTTSLAGALQIYDRWAEDPRVELAAEPRGAETLFRQAIAPFALQSATKAVADCYLIGFAEAAGAHVVTFDRGHGCYRDIPASPHGRRNSRQSAATANRRSGRGWPVALRWCARFPATWIPANRY